MTSFLTSYASYLVNIFLSASPLFSRNGYKKSYSAAFLEASSSLLDLAYFDFLLANVYSVSSN